MTSKKTETKKPLIILTAGGTGGHVYPAESLAEELLKRGYDLALVTDKRGKDNYKGRLGEIKNFSVLSGALVGKSKWFKVKSLAKTMIGVLQSCYILIKNKPICVVGFGGYASFPCSVAAIAMRKKLIIHEQNSVMSRTNRILSKHAALIAQSFKDVKYTPKNIKTVLTGMPIRQSIINIKNREYPMTGKFQIAVLGGSQGAKIFGEVIPQTIKKFDEATQKNFIIYQQCREQDQPDVEKAYEGVKSKVIISHFFNNMPEIYAKTNLMVSRAGASSVSEILAVGIPSILVPLPIAADDHQTCNAKEVAEAKAGFVLQQKDFNIDNLFNIITRLINNKKDLLTMAGNAKSLGITDAAKRFADAINAVIKQKNTED
ncbi:MAG: undecaprenyldiphospho-muramoylpentapeptide beta-N-acetylglucosaminyltransferase [Lactobacillaceae bacterium]|jgi:UDP-N-acetylglucosamine--N-acetylmuramyl-(pentapeptide) pyrophosphoryl-undecaprenol N-acetylglucosamine transferase|nr:undecaprenyldiphospho-muramoylpentapeptide beta-N-acetylglucosaminyltransferase [Lactobacillaceae bacterium]